MAELPPEGHPLRKLGARLTELLDEHWWAECEALLLEGWECTEKEKEDFALMIQRLVFQLSKRDPGNSVAANAVELLRKHGFSGNSRILREGESS